LWTLYKNCNLQAVMSLRIFRGSVAVTDKGYGEFLLELEGSHSGDRYRYVRWASYNLK
jgi:hypothetical protein